ncbi:glycine zipper 2TM domain-containing protein [Hymenobacter sp. BT730]|uniref:YMGG-like glycine zipper-containing protein n=1 Tax=Hymenobacter sp. BT730 TaxID=3063332 RepID=UPI0026E01E8B|nr:glycine zipper 2TM domain-containing protein [Hymenobacter sp. BT730]
MKKVSLLLSLIFLLNIAFTNFSQAQTRKPWSPQAKGAIIGGVGGAAAGALIHKRNRVVGGAVGAAAGAGTGYVIGKSIDNKRKARAAEAARVAANNRAAAAERRAAAARAERSAMARRMEASKQNNGLAVGQQQQYPGAASGFAAASIPAMMYASNGAPMAMNAAYLPNASYGERSTEYPTSEYRRKSW